jgi:hypothetical protein
MIAVRDGTKADDRIKALQERAFFHLFVRSDLAPVAYREDIFVMARDLAGQALANRLWDDTLRPPRRRVVLFNDGSDERHYLRWFGQFKFPNAMPAERIGVIRALARRGDEGAAATLVSFLWHLDDPATLEYDLAGRANAEAFEREALAAAGGLGGACYPAAERFLRAARDPVRRRRAVHLLRLLADPRAVEPLLEALAWETGEDSSYGVAAALEDLGDASSWPRSTCAAPPRVGARRSRRSPPSRTCGRSRRSTGSARSRSSRSSPPTASSASPRSPRRSRSSAAN